jgi:hypothetical protein
MAPPSPNGIVRAIFLKSYRNIHPVAKTQSTEHPPRRHSPLPATDAYAKTRSRAETKPTTFSLYPVP